MPQRLKPQFLLGGPLNAFIRDPVYFIKIALHGIRFIECVSFLCKARSVYVQYTPYFFSYCATREGSLQNWQSTKEGRAEREIKIYLLKTGI